MLEDKNPYVVTEVAPHAGAWIETTSAASFWMNTNGRAPRGRVD